MPQLDDMKLDLAIIAPEVLDALGAAVTIFDPQGVMLYYNQQAPKILDRRPELLGKKIHECHEHQKSRDMIDAMIKRFQDGQAEDAFYFITLPGPHRAVRVTPLFKDGELLACVQIVMKLDRLPKT